MASHIPESSAGSNGATVLPASHSNTQPPCSAKRATARQAAATMLHHCLRDGEVSSESAAKKLECSPTLVDMKRRGERSFELADILMLGPVGLEILHEATALLEGKIALGMTREQAALRASESLAHLQAKIAAYIANDGRIDNVEDADLRCAMATVNSAIRMYRRVSEAGTKEGR